MNKLQYLIEQCYIILQKLHIVSRLSVHHTAVNINHCLQSWYKNKLIDVQERKKERETLSKQSKKLLFFNSDRDIQCDFENPFWEEIDCNWQYNSKLMSQLFPGSNGLQFSRSLGPFSTSNYWKRTANSSSGFRHSKK